MEQIPILQVGEFLLVSIQVAAQPGLGAVFTVELPELKFEAQ